VLPISIGWEEQKKRSNDMDIIKQIVHDYLVLFSMVNAIGNLPIFSELTQDMDEKLRKKIYEIAVLTGGSIVIVFALFGDFMLNNIFEVSTSSFKIAGGILVFIVAARGVVLGSKSLNVSVTNEKSLAIFPMGFPYLAGPGTILTTILLFRNSDILITSASAILVYLSILPILFLAPIVTKVFGQLGVSVISRILYIFISAKAIEFILQGFGEFLKSQ
jgi:multiple antibiotic resistance protein